MSEIKCDNAMSECIVNDAARCPNHLLMTSVDWLIARCHGAAYEAGWWHDVRTGELKSRNTGELLMLMVSELAEAMEGDRKGLLDDKLPHHPMFVVELADCVIRIMDVAGAANIDLGRIIAEKLAYNAQRADHKPENRVMEGGKSY